MDKRFDEPCHLAQAHVEPASTFVRKYYSGKVFNIASPEPITGNELSKILSKKLGREVRFTLISPAQFGVGITQFSSAEAGNGIAELYEATDTLPLDGAVIDLEPVLSWLPVKLTPVFKWIDRQDWTLAAATKFKR